VLHPLAVKQFDPRVVRGLDPPIRDQGIDVLPPRTEPEIAFAVKIDRGGIAVCRHQRLELAVDLVPVLRHADIFGYGEELADAAGGARRRGKLVCRVGLDDDDVCGKTHQRQVIGDRRTDDTAADDRDLGHFPLGSGRRALCRRAASLV